MAHGTGRRHTWKGPNVRHERQTQAQLEAVRSMEGLAPRLHEEHKALRRAVKTTARALVLDL